MGGAQPLAVTMNDGVAIVVEVDPQRVARKVAEGYCHRMTGSIDEALEWMHEAVTAGHALSIGVAGNTAEVLPELVRRNITPDLQRGDRMKPIIECVPNFSEGRNQDSIRQIAAEITSVEGIRLLGVDVGVDTNRTVVSFVGPPQEVVEAAFRAIRKAAQLIDMAVHKGAHPRMGATDVCPLVPVSGITKEECVAHARALAKRVGSELGIPVYLYGYAASRPERTSLPDIREGEYEALPLKMKMPGFVPDEGPASFNPQAGATVIGVRDFMLAYNVNLNTTDATLAKEIAMNIRESGRAKRDAQGAIVKDAQGTTVKVPGRLVSCQADGWYIAQHGCAQITMNLHNYRAVGLHTAFDAVGEEAARLGLRATGSELIGLVPKQAILDAGAHYLRKQGKTAGVPEESLIHCAVRSLGLNEVTEFTPEEKIVEYAVADKRKRLVDMSVKGFVNELSSGSPAPGGGSVAALSGALSAGLASMVANLTYGRKGYEAHAEATDAPMKQADLLIVNTSCLLTLAGKAGPRVSPAMRDLGAIEHGACAFKDGMVVETGSTTALSKDYRADRILDAQGRLAMPGFVDPHTHLVFAGTRDNEMLRKIEGATYLDILSQGGGIHATVRATRHASFEELLHAARSRLDRIVAHGTTTVEIKSGYGLESNTEEKMLSVAAQLRKDNKADIVSTFLGAHTIPEGGDRASYIAWLTNEAMAKFSSLAEFCDVFCDKGAFTKEESVDILDCARRKGDKLKIHAGQFSDCGAAGAAALLGAVSVDHCDFISDEQLGIMRTKGAVAVLLPSVSFFLGGTAYPDVKRIQGAGVPVALATDFNPGSCPCCSMQMIVALACLAMKMKPEEAITAATINAACAIDRGATVGSLEPGKKGDCVVLDIASPSQLPYFFGTNLVNTVIKNGAMLWHNAATRYED